MMRNPARIHMTLALLGQLWVEYPDMRLNQLCQFIASKQTLRTNINHGNDLFMLEDDVFLEQLQIELGKEIKPVDPYFV
jgi:hypothetical protein